MHEDNLIDNLFELARSESPRRSLQDTWSSFESLVEADTKQRSGSGVSRGWLIPGTTGLVIILIMAAYLWQPKPQQTQVEDTIEVPPQSLPDTVKSVTTSEKVSPEDTLDQTIATQVTIGSLPVAPQKATDEISEVAPEEVTYAQPISEPIHVGTKNTIAKINEINHKRLPLEELNIEPVALDTVKRNPVHRKPPTKWQVDRRPQEKTYSTRLERAGGAKSMNAFSLYLDKNEPRGLQMDFSATLNKGLVQKFNIKMKSESGVDVRIQSGGFHSFELHWKLDQENKPYDIWCRFDGKEKKPINIRDHVGKKPIRIKYRSI